MSIYFLQKRIEWKTEKKKKSIQLWVLMAVCLAILLCVAFFVEEVYPAPNIDFGSLLEKIRFWK